VRTLPDALRESFLQKRNILNKLTLISLIGITAFLFLSCKEKSTTSDESPPIAFSSSSSNCLTQTLQKGSMLDSVFTSTFQNTLIIDFSVRANCCPDSNRFVISQSLSHDSILVAVTDTAQNNCRCNCMYMVHCEIAGLPQDRYIVRCRQIDLNGGIIDPIHLTVVNRIR